MTTPAAGDSGQRCINCKAPERDGVIKHLPGCPDYVRPKEKK